MKIIELQLPSDSKVESYLDGIDYRDSYGACHSKAELDIKDIYLGIFAFSPWWVKQLFNVRNKVVGIFGLRGPSYKELHNIECKSEYKVGEKIGLFMLYSLEKNEIIAGGNDKHLNFRVSVQKIIRDNSTTVVVTTIVKFNNIFGRIYLFLIKPFHKYIIKRLLLDAIDSKRI